MKLVPINLQNESILIHPLRKMDMEKIHDIQADLFEILSNEENTKYISEKRLTNQNEIVHRIMGVVLGYQKELSYGHFITDKESNRVIGFVDIITPDYAQQNYYLKKYTWMIEYYLNKSFGTRIMRGVIKAICKDLNNQGISPIGAVCDKSNLASIKVLERVGFSRIEAFDYKQDYYEL